MKMYLTLLIMLTGVANVSEGILEPIYPEAKITVKVVDESGHPVVGSVVAIGLGQGGNAWVGEGKSKNIKGLSDTNGLFSAQAQCAGHIGIGVSKDGYYQSFSDYNYPGTYQNKERWEPWNPTLTVVLRKRINPIPLYVKTVKSDVPVENQSVGFDLEVGDWVAPFGKGVRSDFMISAQRQIVSPDDFDTQLTINFMNEGDGITAALAEPVSIKSLRLPHHAPLTSYKPEWHKRMAYSLPEGFRFSPEWKDNINWFFRIRTILNEEGDIVSAHYGKIHGKINLEGYIADKLTVTFTYYLNPTPNDRNLEFDPDRNLFDGRERFAP